jgi:hypothetical protein
MLTFFAAGAALHGLSLSFDPPANAATSAFVVRMTPVADTWIEMPMNLPGMPTVAPNTTPRGEEPALRAGWSHLAPDERALLRFAVPTTLPDTVLEEAVLELTLVNAGVMTYGGPPPSFGTMSLSLSLVTSAWDEKTLTGAGRLPEFEAVPPREDISWGPCADGRCGTAEVDVLPLVRRWAEAPDSDHGLAIDARYGGPEASFGAYIVAASRESLSAPELRLRYVPAGIDATPTPVSDLPNLKGSAVFDCSRAGVWFTVTNDGFGNTGPFSVASSLGQRWEIDGLDSGENSTIFDPGSRVRQYRIDVDDVVRETDETDNVVDVLIPGCPTPTATRTGGALQRVWLPWAGQGQ